VSELAAANNSLVTSKRKLEIDIQAMQVDYRYKAPSIPATMSKQRSTLSKESFDL